MFEILPNPSVGTILITARAVLLIGAVWVFAIAFIRWRRADERANQRLHAQLERAFAEMRSLHETVVVMNARLDSLSERSDSDARPVPVPVAGAQQRGYDLATRLAKNGAAAEELVGSCGVTRHEAELLVRLHGQRAREVEPAPRAAEARAERTEVTWPLKDRASAGVAAAPAQAPRPNTGRKRGSLVSLVG